MTGSAPVLRLTVVMVRVSPALTATRRHLKIGVTPITVCRKLAAWAEGAGQDRASTAEAASPRRIASRLIALLLRPGPGEPSAPSRRRPRPGTLRGSGWEPPLAGGPAQPRRRGSGPPAPPASV